MEVVVESILHLCQMTLMNQIICNKINLSVPLLGSVLLRVFWMFCVMYVCVCVS